MYFDTEKLKGILPYVGPILVLLGYLRLEIDCDFLCG